MVKRAPLILISFLIFALAVSAASIVNAQTLVYSVDHEWAQIFINQDGTIDLTYNITVSVSQGIMHGFYVGQPNSDFTSGTAVDQNGNSLQVADASSSGDYKVDVTLAQPLTAGQSVWFQVTTNVAGMISNDTTNPGNYGMQFIPQWISDTAISDVRVQIVLPPDVTVADVKTTQNFYNGTSTVNGQLAVYWEKSVIQPNEQVTFGVSFPYKFMPNYNPPQTGGGIDFGILGIILGVVGVLFALVILILIIRAVSKISYTSPKVSMESLGVKRGLTAVEASYLLDMKPPQIVTEILYSLLQKRAVWATETKPSLKLKVLPPFDNKIGPKDNPLRYYEIDFLNALKADGSLDEEKLAHTIMFLRDTIEQKLEGYSRKDTVDYYRKIASQAWAQVEQAGTVELAANAYDEQLLWLMLDPNQRTRTETAFRDRVIQPNPLWFWWWYGYTTYHPNPTYTPNPSAPAQSGPPPAIPGADFANTIATSVEKTSNNIVVNIEKFANAIVPPPPKASHDPVHPKADCVCACHACACACACVSCACACAGGGGH
jgi:Na+-transporting methylmalonyl-CoA/oxaloacetate decarboxylase gamma subunit